MKLLAIAAFVFVSGNAYATTPDILYSKISHVMATHPEISEMEICVESTCETYLRDRRINPDAYADPSTPPFGGGVSDAVGEIINSAAKSVGIGGRIIVDYEKKKDGSVKVHVEASFGTGAGSGAGAASSNPDFSDK